MSYQTHSRFGVNKDELERQFYKRILSLFNTHIHIHLSMHLNRAARPSLIEQLCGIESTHINGKANRKKFETKK